MNLSALLFRTGFGLVGASLIPAVVIALGCGSTSDGVTSAVVDAADELVTVEDGPDLVPSNDAGADAARSPCVASQARFCDDFDVPDGGISKWSFFFVDDGGTAAPLDGDAVSPPRHLRASLPNGGFSGELATIMRTLSGAPEVTYAADVRVVSRKDAGELMIHRLYAPTVQWSLSLSLSPDGDRLLEDYLAASGFKVNSTPLSRQFPVGTWVHVVMYAQVGVTTADSWVTFDDEVVASMTLAGLPGISQDLRAVAGLARRTPGTSGAMVDVDNVDVLVE